jgi:hypothetical protein
MGTAVSLSVMIYRRADGSAMDEVEGVLRSDLAGFERWRKTVYGSPILVSRGATQLPQLANSDLYLESLDDLEAAAADCRLILANLDEVALHAGTEAETVAYRVNNILTAVDFARDNGVCVVVW